MTSKTSNSSENQTTAQRDENQRILKERDDMSSKLHAAEKKLRFMTKIVAVTTVSAAIAVATVIYASKKNETPED